MSTSRIVIDSDVCSGHGRCYSLHPELFDADDSGYPLVLEEAVAPDQVSNARDAAGNCPEAAITVTSTGETDAVASHQASNQAR